MDNPLVVIYIMAGIFISATLALFALVIYSNNKHRKKLEEITLYQINVSATIDQSIPEILDLIIQESFTDYQVKYLAPMNEGFINEEREAAIRKDLVQMVSLRISNAALDKLSLFYNIKNIADIIADKIYICVMNYVTEHNSVYMKDE